MYRLIEHALKFKPDDPLTEQHHRLARQHLHGYEEDAAEAEYDFFDDTSEEGDDFCLGSFLLRLETFESFATLSFATPGNKKGFGL